MKKILSVALVVVLIVAFVMVFVSQKQDNNPSINTQIIGNWTLIKFNDQEIDLQNASNENNLVITTDTISGKLCNGFSSDNYQINDDIITASLISTQMACIDNDGQPTPIMSAETALGQGLYYGFKIAFGRNHELILQDVDNLLVFIPQE